MKLGGELEWERQMKTLDFLFANQTESGLFHGVIDNDDNILGDGFPNRGDRPGCENWHLIRKTKKQKNVSWNCGKNMDSESGAGLWRALWLLLMWYRP